MLLIPVTRAIVGTTIGIQSYRSIVFATVPFYSRQVQLALTEVDKGVIEAGVKQWDVHRRIIFRVYLKKACQA